MGEPPQAGKGFSQILDAKMSMPSRLRLPITGMRRWRSLGLQAGKHVYVEKPCSHNPAEGEMLVEAQQKYRQAGADGNAAALITAHHRDRRQDPRRSDRQAVFRESLVQQYAQVDRHGQGGSRAAATRLGSLAGPSAAPAYKDNVQPYNWHWFRTYGTGETLNNGTHEVDVCRWALGVDYPNRVTASGGRYHFKDDWQFYDTLVTSFEYDDKMISWEGKSCQGMKYYDRDRGSRHHGNDRHACSSIAMATRSTT